MIGRTLLIAFSVLAFTIVPGVARAEIPAQQSKAPAKERAQNTAPAERQRPVQTDADRYAEREQSNQELEEFKGGDRVIISIGLGTVLVILLIVLLI